ncbi:hypothetical protein MA16_Dca003948 [Dendrobium catenatum]|uniref:Uncharacterized protein n=1 Tax=Dendrobium catenatum TaxID=906689 RepID=A0A2I0X1Z9_9ASPA|nr:hypothetical protein MA16_Dca003948 [Dendrobium catenatum]
MFQAPTTSDVTGLASSPTIQAGTKELQRRTAKEELQRPATGDRRRTDEGESAAIRRRKNRRWGRLQELRLTGVESEFRFR